MDTLTQLQQNRRIIHDLTLSTLARISCLFSRLAYLASLRDISTNVYEHAGLAAIYPRMAVRQALEQCHQEVFERILEMPLLAQEEDWRAQCRDAVAKARIVPRATAGRLSGVPQRAFLLECPCNSGDSRERAFNGTGSRVTMPTTRPTISASSGVFQDSGMHRESGWGCITNRPPSC